MDDLKSVSLAYLRDLARTHLGPGHSKLSKKELIAALAEFVPALKKLARLAGIELPTRAKPAAKAAPSATQSSREPRGKEARVAEKKEPERKKEPEKKAAGKKEPEKKAAAERKKEPEQKAAERKKEPEKKAAAPQSPKTATPRQAAPKVEEAAQPPKPAQVVNFPPRPRATRSAEEQWAEESVVDSPELEAVFQHAAEPLMEGFFVARLMGERELRRHHLTEEQAASSGVAVTGFEEDLGELPLDYGNDLALALARDPHTLFITWDFSQVTLGRVRDELDAPRAMLRVFDGDRLVRELEFLPESRSFYIHGLPPGRPYRVEAHFVGRDGRSRRLGHSTHPLTLPRTGLSPDMSVRFMQMPPPPQVPVSSPAPGAMAPTGPLEEIIEEHEYITWHRVPLPGSDEAAKVAQSRRERTTRRAPESASPPERQEHLDIEAPPRGSSEQSPPRHLEYSARPLGSSEQTHWTPPSSGRGR